MAALSVPRGVFSVSTFAGSSRRGLVNGPADVAAFNSPWGVGADGKGNVFVSDSGNHCIRKIDPDGMVTIYAGGAGASGYVDGVSVAARFSSPGGLVVANDGSIFLADYNNHRIRRISPEGAVSTLAGSGSPAFVDGCGPEAGFEFPNDVTMDFEGSILVADCGNHAIRKVSQDGAVTTLAGCGYSGYADGCGSSAQFHGPGALAADVDGAVLVADMSNHYIRKISRMGMVTTLAGGGIAGSADGPGAAARFESPGGVAIDGEGNIIVADSANHRICKVTPDGIVTTLVGSGVAGYADGHGNAVQFSDPLCICITREGAVLVADSENHCLRRLATRLKYPCGAPAMQPRASSLVQDLRTMLRDPTHADVIFVVRGEDLPGHLALLAHRCEHLARMVVESAGTCGPDTDGRPGGAVRVENVDVAPSVFRALLEYLYTDELHVDDDDIVELMRLSHEYGLDRVHNICASHCRRTIGPGNALQILVHADASGLEDLRALSFRYTVRNFRAIREESRGSLALLKQHPDLMIEIMECI